MTDAQTYFEAAIAISHECHIPLIALQAKVGLAKLALETGEIVQAEQQLQAVLGHRAVTESLRRRCEALFQKMTG